jgi:biotin carboxyl carrier protein
MKRSLLIDGREHTLEWVAGEVSACSLDGERFDAQAVEISPGVFSILIGGKSYTVRVAASGAGLGDPTAEHQYSASVEGRTYSVAVRDPRRWSRGGGGAAREGPQRITAPMPGKVVRVLVAEGDQVAAGQGLIVVEAMKMQNEIKATAAGFVKKLLVAAGQPVGAGDSLVVIE